MIIEERLRDATCQIRCGSQIGTGWLITPKLIVTAKHCVALAKPSEGAEEIVVEFGLGEQATERVAVLHESSPDLDVSVIRLPEPLDIAPIPWSKHLPRPGARWVAFGRPTSKVDIGHRLEGSISQILEGRPSGIDLEVAVDSGSALSEYAGFSGAAVVCAEGCVGILVSTADTAVCGISIASLLPMLSSLRLEQDEQADDSPRLAPRLEFQASFEEALLAKRSGFLFLEGAPGIGKSTFCKEYVPIATELEFIGTYSFSSDRNGLGSAYWAQPEVFEDWLRVLYTSAVSATPARLTQLSYPQMITAVHGCLSAIGSRCRSSGKIGMIFIDGLNEAQRADPQAFQRLVGLLPLTPIANLIVVFASTSYTDPSSILGSRVGRMDKLSMLGLTREGVAAFCAAELIPERATPALIAEVCDRAAGHPLYLRYLIDLANGGASESDLHALPAFSGDIEDYYETIWSSIAADDNAVQVLGLMARLRWGIPIAEFLTFVDAEKRRAFHATLPRIRHLLERADATSFYHGSFALFLSSKTAVIEADVHEQLASSFRGNLNSNYATLNRVYHGLHGGQASQTHALQDCSQEWVDQCVVLGVAPDTLLEDVDDAVSAATKSGIAVKAVELLLLSQRVRHRYNILFARAADLAVRALVALDKPRDALRFLVRQGHLLVPFDEALAVAVKLIDVGGIDQAYELLEELDVRLLDALTEKIDTDTFIQLVQTRIQSLVLMISIGRAPTQQDMPTFIAGVRAAVRANSGDSDRQRQSAIMKPIESSFFATMLCFTNSKKNWFQDLPEQGKEAFFSSIHQLAAILLSIREHSEIYGRKPDAVALRSVVEKFEEKTRREISLSPGTRLAVSDSIVFMGGAVDVVTALVEEQVESKTLSLEFTKDNHALVEVRSFLQAYSVQRLRGYIGSPAIVLPDAYWGTTSWLPMLEQLATDLARWEGAARAAKVTAPARLDHLWLDLENRILPKLRFDLAARVKWEGSYATPERLFPLLYKMLAQVFIDCYPERIGLLFDSLDTEFDRQYGLYSEGFRAILSNVLELVSREAIRMGWVPRVMNLMVRWKSYVLRNVQNRVELVPEILRMIPLFVDLGATEEAGRTYQAALSNSMGPNWYKEDQFSMMGETLACFPFDDSSTTAMLPRIQSYLDSASGELTFQRFVRYAKQDLLGEFCRRGLHHQAVRQFTRQMCGSQDELYSQATTSDADRVSRLVGMRFPGRELDEQAAVIELVEGCADAAGWRTSWAILELFHEGDHRHLARWAQAYARLTNRQLGLEDEIRDIVQRMRDLSLRRYKDNDWETLFKDFLGRLDPSLRARFADLGHPASSSEREVAQASAVSPRAETSASGSIADSATEGTSETRTPTQEELDGFYLPGTFGRSSSLGEASAVLERAETALALKNFEAARAEAIHALQVIQRGGWSIWQDSSEHIRRAESIMDSTSATASEVTKLYGTLLQAEKHNYRWVTANKFIRRISGKLNGTERRALCEVVLDHMRLLLGDAAPTVVPSSGPAVSEEGPESALFLLLIWTLDHPKPKVRHEASRRIFWLLRHDDAFLRYAASHAFSADHTNAPDIIIGALDVISREFPKRLWERIEGCRDSQSWASQCRHLGRFAVLRQVASRAAEAGSASARAELDRFDQAWHSAHQPFTNGTLSKMAAAPASWGNAGAHEWEQLLGLSIATSAIAARAESILQEACAPLDVVTARELEDLVAEGFTGKRSFRLGRWDARVRFALHGALFEMAPRDKLVLLHDALRICNPSPLRAPIEGRFPLAQLFAGAQDRWKRFRPEDSNQVFLCYQGIIDGAEGHVQVDVIAFLRPNGGGFAFPPPMEASFQSTQLPRPAVHDPAVVCAFAKPRVAYFGSLTPAILQPSFAEHLGAPASAIHRSTWYDWSQVDGDNRIYARESAALSVSKSSLRLPDGYRLSWVVRFDGKAVGTIN